MDIKILLINLVLCVVLIDSKVCDNDRTSKHGQEFTESKRFKRAKYYSSPPPGAVRYFRRPPPSSYPPRTTFSNTPPPNFMADDNEPSYPPNNGNYEYKPSYVSKKPNDGLGDDDINNIIKYLSKQDLDKLIEFATEKDSPKKVKASSQIDSDIYEFIKANNHDGIDNTKQNQQPNEKLYLDAAYVGSNPHRQISQQFDYSNGNDPKTNVVSDATQTKFTYYKAPLNYKSNYPTANFEGQESMQAFQNVLYANGQFVNQVNNLPHADEISATSNEEALPKPINLREEASDVEGAYSKAIPSYAKPPYKVENLGDLPVMDYHSKMFSVSSYKVPHYSITSSSSVTNSKSPPVEPAPPASAAQAQSDAHLKAVKIWTHRSKGHAYTLHDDGTLSVELPFRPKPKYGAGYH